MKKAWRWVLGVLGALVAVLAFILYRRNQADHVDTLKDALVVAKAERKIGELDVQRVEVEKRIIKRQEDIDEVNQALDENRKTIVEARTGAKDLDAEGVMAVYRKMGYVK